MTSTDARARLRKQILHGARPFLKYNNADLIDINTLGSNAQHKARRFAEIGEIEFIEIGRRLFATRGDLADWEVIDPGCDVDPSGEFHG